MMSRKRFEFEFRVLPWWSSFWLLGGISLLVWANASGLGWFVGKYAWTGKDFQEVLGPTILAAAMVIGLYQFLVDPNEEQGWRVALPLILFCREWHFAGTGTGVFIALSAWIFWGFHDAAVRASLPRRRAFVGHTLGAFLVYALAMSLDIGCWKFLALSSLYSTNLEETLESLGHFAILTALFATACFPVRTYREERPLNPPLSASMVTTN